MNNVTRLDNKRQNKYYVIADDYKWHVVTDSGPRYFSELMPFLRTMESSPNAQSYYIKTVFMTEDEYTAACQQLKNFWTGENIYEAAVKKQMDKPKFELIDGGTDGN